MHIQAGQCGNQIGAKVSHQSPFLRLVSVVMRVSSTLPGRRGLFATADWVTIHLFESIRGRDGNLFYLGGGKELVDFWKNLLFDSFKLPSKPIVTCIT